MLGRCVQRPENIKKKTKMSIKKKHMNWMMLCKLPLGASLWAILFFFIFTACQDDLPETTEVMMTFTTRAVVTDKVDSNAPDEDKMQDLRVIMLRQDGTVVDNHLEENINASSVTFTFSTPIQIDGEDFTFLAVANEESIQSTSTIDWLKCSSGVKLSEETITQIKEQQIGNGEAFNISDGPIPQTKQWTVHVPQQDTHVENQTLDFVASKISVQFINNTNAEQSLNDVKITGIGYNVYGYLFAHNSADFVGENHNASDITFTDVTKLAVGVTSAAQTYYTYPIGSLSSPTLHATWNGSEYDLPIKINDEFITALNRNDHLKIIVTLTGQELVVNYTIAAWNTDNTTNIGSPTPEGGYQVDDWGNGNDVIIGGGEEPDTPVVPGDVIWEGTQEVSWSSSFVIPNYDKSKHAGKTLVVKVIPYGETHRTISFENENQTAFCGFSSNDKNLPQSNEVMSLEVKIPNDLNSLTCRGELVTLKGVYLSATQ